MKIGRNDPCPCGSGKKYKKCCLRSENPPTEPRRPSEESLRSAMQALRAKQAEEEVRIQQQGHGHPIVSFVDHGYRLVAVGNTIHWSNDWTVFPDFLLYFLKKTFNPEWGRREQATGRHPLFRWLEKFNSYSASQPSTGKLKSAPTKGFLACWLHLAYSLYLIEHNDSLPKSLLRRLRDPEYFLPAFYETLVGSALAVAGFEISCAETRVTSDPLPEFRAKSKNSGKMYNVEAKRKNGWKVVTDDVAGKEFQDELQRYIRDQLHSASRKKLENAIYWFELSIPTLVTEEAWRVVVAKASEVLREAEKSMTVDGQPVNAAFVVITNYTFIVNEDMDGQPTFAALDTVNIPDFPIGRTVELEAALEAYDQYRDIFWMVDSWKIAQVVPTTFDGSPPELLTSGGEVRSMIKIGSVLQVPDQAGAVVSAQVVDIVSVGQMATALVSANGRTWLVSIPLAEHEVAAASRFTDAVFGKNDVPVQLDKSDPFGLYEFFLRTYSTMNQEQVNALLRENTSLRVAQGLPLKDACRRIAREFTKVFWAKNTDA